MGVNFGTGPRCFIDDSSTTLSVCNSEWSVSRSSLELLEFGGPKWSEFCWVLCSIFPICGFGRIVAISPFYVRPRGRVWVLVLPKSPVAGSNSRFPLWCWSRRILEFGLFLGEVVESVGLCFRFVAFSRGACFLFFGQCDSVLPRCTRHCRIFATVQAKRYLSTSAQPPIAHHCHTTTHHHHVHTDEFPFLPSPRRHARTPTRIHGRNDVRVFIDCRWSRLNENSEEDCAEAMEDGGCWRNCGMPTDPFQPGFVRRDIEPI